MASAGDAIAPLLVAFSLGLTAMGCGGDTFGPAEGEGNFAGTLKSDGVERSYSVHTPPGFEATDSLPLLIALHGVPGTGLTMRIITGFDAIADELRFVVAYPDAAFGEWTVGCECSSAEAEGVQDTRFVSDLVDELHGRLGIDRSRVSVAGFSQGALMSFRLGCELASQLRGIAAIAATMLANITSRCAPAAPMPIVVMHGTDDSEFPPGGRVGTTVTSISIDATVETWVALNECDAIPTVVMEPDTADDGTLVRRETYGLCRGGSEVVTYFIEGGGHTWPGSPAEFGTSLGTESQDIDASRTIAEFFLRFAAN
jgi:polyhydroxybutyrate depolymerase